MHLSDWFVATNSNGLSGVNEDIPSGCLDREGVCSMGPSISDVQTGAGIEKEGQESKISRTLQQPSTSCLSFSSQFLSTEQEERRCPQTGQEDRKTG